MGCCGLWCCMCLGKSVLLCCLCSFCVIICVCWLSGCCRMRCVILLVVVLIV